MKKGKEKAPLNKAAVLRGMMIKNFGTAERQSAGEATGAQEKKMKYLRKKTEALPRGSGVRKEVSHEKGQAVRGRTCE